MRNIFCDFKLSTISIAIVFALTFLLLFAIRLRKYNKHIIVTIVGNKVKEKSHLTKEDTNTKNGIIKFKSQIYCYRLIGRLLTIK